MEDNMNNQSQSIANNGSVVYRTMLEDLANAQNGGKKQAETAPASESVSMEKSISAPFKDQSSSAPAKELKKIDAAKIFKILAVLLVASGVIIGGKFGYDWIAATYFAEEAEEEAVPIEQQPLFDADQSVKMFLDEGDELNSLLIGRGDDLYQAGIVQFVVYKDKVNPIDLGNLVAELGLSVPEAVKASFGSEYMLYVSVDSENLDSRYRLNLAVAIEDVESLSSALRNWEVSMQEDLASLHLIGSGDFPSSVEFLDNSYTSISGEIVPIRYLNIADAYTTFDYAIVESEKILLLNTTKEAIFSSLDLLIKKPAAENVLIEEIIEEENAESSEEVLEEEELPQSMGSRQILNLFAQELESGSLSNIGEYVVEAKKDSIVEYLSGLAAEVRAELGAKIRTEASVMYEKSNIALYVVDCSFFDADKDCNFYLEKIGEEWKIVQM